MKKSVTFRLSDECRQGLAELARLRDCTRTEVIEHLVAKQFFREDTSSPDLAVTGLVPGDKITVVDAQTRKVLYDERPPKPTVHRQTIPKPDWKK